MPVSGMQKAPQEIWHISPSQKVAPPPPSSQGSARAKGDQNEGSVSPATVFPYWLTGKLLIVFVDFISDALVNILISFSNVSIDSLASSRCLGRLDVYR